MKELFTRISVRKYTDQQDRYDTARIHYVKIPGNNRRIIHTVYKDMGE